MKHLIRKTVLAIGIGLAVAPVAVVTAGPAQAITAPDFCNLNGIYRVVVHTGYGKDLVTLPGWCSGVVPIQYFKVPVGVKIDYVLTNDRTSEKTFRTAGGGSAEGRVYIAAGWSVKVTKLYAV